MTREAFAALRIDAADERPEACRLADQREQPAAQAADLAKAPGHESPTKYPKRHKRDQRMPYDAHGHAERCFTGSLVEEHAAFILTAGQLVVQQQPKPKPPAVPEAPPFKKK